MEMAACETLAYALGWIILAAVLLTAGTYNAPNRRK
jgi:hypothetical protein